VACAIGLPLARAQPSPDRTSDASPAAPTARVSPGAATLPSAAAAETPGAPPAGKPAAAAAPPSVSPSPLNPTPSEFPKAADTLASPELDAMMARVTALRARIAALSAAMFSSKLRVELRSQSEGARLKTLRVSLDGGVVYTAPAQALFDRPEIVYEHAVATGPHVLAVEVERQDLRGPQFSTWQTSRFVVLVPEKRLLWTRLELEDESSMGEDFAEDEAGQYDLGVRLQVEVSE
jgi:hypothetical protein